jgi:hypothetical protein
VKALVYARYREWVNTPAVKAKIKANRLARLALPGANEHEKARVRAYSKRPHVKAGRQNYGYKKRYGITLEMAVAMKANGCGILGCQSPATEMDHDHTTGKIRGALCRKHNLFLGHIESAGPAEMAACNNYLARGGTA